jgi:hypothetical protein
MAINPRYFRSFASYELPYRPLDPVEFKGTAGLATYYRADFDEAGRVVCFDKILLERVSRGTFKLPHAERPGLPVYYDAHRNSDDKAAPYKRIDYAETESQSEFIAGTVDDTGLVAHVSHLRRNTEFRDEYTYWPNGQLRRRTRNIPRSAVAVEEHYDADGRRIETRTPAELEQEELLGTVPTA